MNDELVDLAQSTQRRHAELLAEANRRLSIEARVEVRNDLDALDQEFTQRALGITGVSAPYMWLPENPDHAVAIAVRRDIKDTEQRLAALAFDAVLQKNIAASAPGGGILPPGPDWTKIVMVLGLVLIGYAIFIDSRSR